MKFVFHIHLARDYPDRVAGLAETYPDHQFVVAESRESLFTEIVDADVLVDFRASEDLLDAAEHLKWVFVPFSGVNALPLESLSERGIRVANNHGNAPLVAERALALALAAMGRIVSFDRGLRQGHWHRREGNANPFVFWESLAGRRVSILGTGAIGGALAAYLEPFGCDVLGFRRRSAIPVPPGYSRVTAGLDEALGHAEVCFITLPLTESTRGLMDRGALGALKGACLVNVSRGPIVDEEALYRALADRRLGSAGLDAWWRYPEPFHADRLPSEYPFHELENVVLSPHAGSHAPSGKEGQMDGVVENIIALIEAGAPRDIVDPSAGY